MHQEKIQRWLKLPDGPWPPNFYALIGLKPGDGNAAEIEARILERLELLRKYQLAHPDEATEGMSLLARALDCLTNSESRREYDQSLGLTSRVKEVKVLTFDEVLKEAYADIPDLPKEVVEPIELKDLPVGIILPDVEDELEIDDDLDLVDDEPIKPEPIKLELAEPPSSPRRKTKLLNGLPEGTIVPDSPKATKQHWKPKYNRPRSSRRDRYADAARIRKVLRIFEKAHPYFTNHEKGYSRYEDTVGLIACLAELKPLLPTVSDLIGGPRDPGNLLATVTRQRLMINTFENFLPSQRERLANDFRAAYYRLADYYEELREVIDEKKAKTPWREFGVPVVRFYSKYPELGLIPVGLSALMIAILRH